MATIGGITVEILRGNTTPEMQRVQTWSVAGLNGIGAQLMGSNQSGFQYLAILYGVESAVETRLVNLAGLMGTVVTIADDFGETRGACLVTNVGIPRRKAIEREGSSQIRAAVQISGVRTA